MTYDFATDFQGEIARAYEIMYYPTSVFIDRAGRIYRTDISTLDAEKLGSIIREMPTG